MDTKRDQFISPPDLSHVVIDPDGPTFCLCDKLSHGEMMGCDNDLISPLNLRRENGFVPDVVVRSLEKILIWP